MEFEMNYDDFKSILKSKYLIWQYTSFPNVASPINYFVFAQDGPLTYFTTIWFAGYEPLNSDTVAMAASKTNFETNYKSTANSSLQVAAGRNASVKGYVSLTNTTETTLIAAQGSGVFVDLTLLVFASTATSSQTTISIRDATAGSVVASIIVPGNTVGVVLPFTPPFPQTTANNNWTIQSSVAISNGVKITALGLKHN